ncbi:MAG: hypothetical protein N4A46_05365 [Schleiferiaceae bacterium]|jgi:hypothetical protein|nr:hypothetical protein [Schleiferiaceae bacterium]
MHSPFIIETKSGFRLKLKRGEWITHYFICFFLGFIAFLFFKGLIEISANVYEGVVPSEDLWMMLIVWGGMCTLSVVWQVRKLRFKEFLAEYSNDEFNSALKRTSKLLSWRIVLNESGLAVAERESDFTASSGERITFVKQKGRLFINSVVNPGSPRPSLHSFGWNQRNTLTFLEQLSQVKKDIPFQMPPPEKEWSLKNTLGRILKYVFALVLLSVCFILIKEAKGIEGVIIPVVVIIIALIYLILDVMIVTKRKAKEKR